MKSRKTANMNETKDESKIDNQPEDNEPLYAWITLIGVTLCFGIINGTVRSYGLIYVEMLGLFNEGPLKTSLVITVNSISSTAASVVFGFLSDQITARWVVMTAGVFSCLAFVATSFAPSLTFVFLSYGLLLGICDSVVCIFCLGILNQYFRKWRSLANGIATAGSSLGALLLPFLFAFLIDRYSVRGLFLVCGGLWLNISVSGALLRPIASARRQLKVAKTSEGRENKAYEVDNISQTGTLDTKEENGANKADNSRERAIASVVKFEYDNGGSNTNQAEIDQIKEIQFLRSGNTNIKNVIGNKFSTRKKIRKLQGLLKCLCSFKFFLLVVLWFIGGLGFLGTTNYLPAYSVEKNINLSETSLFLSLIGGFDLFGKLVVGYVGDRGVIPKRLLVAVALLITGTATNLLPMFSSYTGFVIYCCLFGTTSGTFIPLAGPLTVEVLGVERVGAGVGIFSLCIGISAAVQPILFSTMKNATGSYAAGFFLIGGANIFNAFITIFAHFFSTRGNKKEYKMEVDCK